MTPFSSTPPLAEPDRCWFRLAKMRGARVFGTVSTAEKARLAQSAGADATINYSEQDFAAEVRRLTGGNGVNVVYDSVGQATFEKSLDCLAPLGSLVIFGQASGPVPPFDTAVLNAKGSLTLARPSLTHNVASHADVLWRAGDLFKWLGEGKLTVRIGQTYCLSRAARCAPPIRVTKVHRQDSPDSVGKNKEICTAGAQRSDASPLLRKPSVLKNGAAPCPKAYAS